MSADRASTTSDGFRIGACLSLFPPVIGGAELLLLELAKRWVSAGHPTTVFTRTHETAPSEERIEGIRVRRIIRTIDAGPMFGATFVTSLTGALLRYASEYDVLLAFQAPWETAGCGMAIKVVRKPMVVAIQQSGPYGDLAQTRRAKGSRILRSFLRRGKQFIGLSRHAAQELVEFGCPEHSVHVITNGIDLAKFHPPTGGEKDKEIDRSRTVLFVGRFVPQKNPEFLLRAWAKVNASGRFRLLLVGAGPLEDQMRRLCNERALVGVRFLGKQSDMVSVYHQASVLALPSVGEGCCMALLESMACGLCPVATNVGGNLDVVQDGVHGLLVPPNDDDALAKALLDVLHDSERRESLSAAALRKIREHHDIERAASDYLAVFQNVLDSK